MVPKKTFAKMTILTLAAGAVLLTGTLTMAASQDPAPSVANHHGMKKACRVNKEMRKNRDSFLLETKELRKNMMMKRATMRAMMHAANPDPAKISSLAGEIFDLREQLRTKARAKGLPGLGFMGHHGMRPGCELMKYNGSMMDGHHSEKL